MDKWWTLPPRSCSAPGHLFGILWLPFFLGKKLEVVVARSTAWSLQEQIHDQLLAISAGRNAFHFFFFLRMPSNEEQLDSLLLQAFVGRH